MFLSKRFFRICLLYNGISLLSFLHYGVRAQTGPPKLQEKKILDSVESRIKYQFEPDGVSFSIKENWDNSRKMLRMQHSDEKDYVTYDEYFNRAVKRGHTILATGDKPRFAVLYSARQSKTDPDLVKMGDGRIRMTIGDKTSWLDELPIKKTVFSPSSTTYFFSLPQFRELDIQLVISQAGNWGAVASVQLTNRSAKNIRVKTELVYGGLRTCGRTFSASYFSPAEKENLESNQINIYGNESTLSDQKISGKVWISSMPSTSPVADAGHVLFPVLSNLAPGKAIRLYYTVGVFFDDDPANHLKLRSDPAVLIRESVNYYQELLATYQVSTPSPLLNSAFKTALLNFDNIYADKAWLEGIHWWSAYWTNNFQISAAIALGEFSKAKKALEFFNSSAYGPCPVLKADGTPDIQSKNGEDGLPYYIYNLTGYFQSTGDRNLLIKLWPTLRKSIDLLWTMRDRDGNGLINWHMGANAFLYQADHLEMPGDAASPSIMMAAMLSKLAVVADKIGQTEDATRWSALSEKINKNLQQVLWDQPQGAFYNHRDEQGLMHSAHYYTDLVYPSLYSNLPEIFGWQSMDYLSRFFWADNYKGQRSLMRVGEFKPSIFGNDNVMPVQMAEAARGYFKLGDNERGIRLMESVALAGTVFTEAPGNFPERMNDEGKGEANYLFGNPIGSFLYSFINGLFGLEIKNENKTLSFEPAFPRQWNQASISLPYASMHYTKSNIGNTTRLSYRVIQNKARKTTFSILLEPCQSIKVTCNDKPVNFQTVSGLQNIRISFQLNENSNQHIVIQFQPVVMPVEAEIRIKAGEAFQWEAPGEIEYISDPQKVLSSPVITGNRVSGMAGQDTGWHNMYVQLRKIPLAVKLNIHIAPVLDYKKPINLKRTFFNEAKIIPVDISTCFNTDRIFLASRWRYEYAARDSVYFTSITDGSKKILEEYGYVSKKGNTMAMICRGISDAFTTETRKSLLPDSLEISINRKLAAISFLWISETQARNTGMDVGYITLKYVDGTEKETRLKVGENLDASWKYFASATEPVLLQGEDYAKTYTLPCDPGKELRTIIIRLTAADVQLGLMGVNMVLPSVLPIVGAIRWDGWFYDTATLFEGTKRLDALSATILEYKQRNKI